MSWLQDLLTGRDNETLAIGRVLGLVVFLVFLIAVPIGALVLLVADKLTAEEWTAVTTSLQVYVPAICIAVAGLIGLTANAEPKGKNDA